MIRLRIAIPLFLLISIHCTGQSRLRKLPSNINHPAINVSSPYISLDGNSLVFISDNSDENQLTMFFTTKRDAVNWNDPVMMPKTVNNRLNFLNGFALSADGKTLYLSSLKSGGLGGFDIVVSQLKGTTWSEPENLGLPINSIGHEAAPSLTADESTLYFMRCEKMDQKTASNCKIFMSKKSRLGRWEEPVALPDYINTGNSQAPRILGDNETLLFSSDQLPNSKGGMDLYMTRFENESWSKPTPLIFANSSRNDQYVSASSLGRYLLKDQPGQRTNELVEILFPPEIKPKATTKVDGVVSGIENLSSPYVAVFDLTTQKRVYSGRPEKNGAFTLFLKEGKIYDVSVEPEREVFSFFSKIYDLTGDQIPQLDKIAAEIKPIAKGTQVDLAISFEPNSSTLSTNSMQELRRVARMVKGNSNYKFGLDLSLYGYLQDSTKSSPELTEVLIDTIHYKVEKLIPDTLKIDSLLSVLNNLDSMEYASADSTLIHENKTLRDKIDSLRINSFVTVVVDTFKIKRTYHNDRTQKQLLSIIESLKKEAVPVENVALSHKAIPEPVAEKRKMEIKLSVLSTY